MLLLTCREPSRETFGPCSELTSLFFGGVTGYPIHVSRLENRWGASAISNALREDTGIQKQATACNTLYIP